ncbi:hypothetical protein ACFPTR_11880, partial [Aliibacillus thermotolerans]
IPGIDSQVLSLTGYPRNGTLRQAKKKILELFFKLPAMFLVEVTLGKSKIIVGKKYPPHFGKGQ